MSHLSLVIMNMLTIKRHRLSSKKNRLLRMEGRTSESGRTEWNGFGASEGEIEETVSATEPAMEITSSIADDGSTPLIVSVVDAIAES
jgi:hypothetical protein